MRVITHQFLRNRIPFAAEAECLAMLRGTLRLCSAEGLEAVPFLVGIKSRIRIKSKVNGNGQECPFHTSWATATTGFQSKRLLHEQCETCGGSNGAVARSDGDVVSSRERCGYRGRRGRRAASSSASAAGNYEDQ